MPKGKAIGAKRDTEPRSPHDQVHIEVGTEPDHLVSIVGALVSPVGPAPERETVTLLNASPTTIDLTGWEMPIGSRRPTPTPV